MVEFEINHYGEVENPFVSESTPPSLFELSALHAVKQFQFDPKSFISSYHKFISDRPVRVKGIWLFSFDQSMDGQSVIKVPVPEYPASAIQKDISEGSVIVEFEWKQIGEKEVQDQPHRLVHSNTRWIYAPANPTIIFAAPMKVFDESALQALAKVRYEFDPLLNIADRPKPPDSDDHFRTWHRFEYSLDSNPKHYVIPNYPREAIQQEIEGNVIVNFDITTEGTVQNPKVVHADVPDIFDVAAVESVSEFTFEPRNEVSINVLHSVGFQLNSELELLSANGVQDRDLDLLELTSVRELLEWYIDIEFDVNESGIVESAEIIESNAPIRQQQLALQHARHASYKPKIVAGKPTRVSNLQHRYLVTPVMINSIKKISEVLALDGAFDLPLYSINAEAYGQVFVEFDVDEHGMVENSKIVDSSPKDFYTNLSLAVVNEFRYKPMMVKGKYVGVSNVRHRLLYSPEVEPNSSYRVHLDEGKPRFGMTLHQKRIENN